MIGGHEDPREYVQISYSVLEKMVELFAEGENPAAYLMDNHIYCIAIYGMGNLGNLFYRILTARGIEVLYGIDQNADKMKDFAVPVFAPTDELREVDAVLVTPVKFFYAIESMINRLMPEVPVISVETVVEYRRMRMCEK